MLKPFCARGACFAVEARQIPHRAHVAAVVARLVDRRFQDETRARQRPPGHRPPTSCGCVRTRPKRLKADVALADVFVPIHARTERRLGVIDVNDGNTQRPTVRSSAAIVCDKPRFGMDFVAACEGMRRVETNSQRQIRHGVENRSQLLEARTKRRAHARSIFQQQPQPAVARIVKGAAQANAARGLADGLRHGSNALLRTLPSPRRPQHDPGCTTR